MKKDHMIERERQLGMPYGTARNKLNKHIMFSLVSILDLNVCFQCGKLIEDEENFSVEHKTPWLHTENPAEMFFDLDNIAFSHTSCNYSAARVNVSVKRPPGESGFKGVRPARPSRKTRGVLANPNRNRKAWVAEVRHGGKTITVGSFDTAREAAIAYDARAIEIKGKDAITNASLGLL